ncbi:prepilin peptidase [Orenia marismortui]|uniref:Prepilin leader peptidase/N-methyltransferase n=1 Tax=Orenia marismortui TaxID=46469 RepID=A0A4R8H128_9FIRM|nr:A24 family peptidase [Orenia marismortui]TDX53034.1 leader peptidase (prepilin peptidase)/N-methyltransferase [Orenia marismortui]
MYSIDITVFILGLIIGSFLNVVIYRLPENKSIIWPGSHCTNCQTNLKIFDLIPVLSFIFTKGRCRYCDTKVSYQYPAVELLTALLFLISYWRYSLSIEFLIYSGLIALLIVCTFIDLKYQIIPNKITYPGIIIFFIISFFFNHITIKSSLLGIVLSGGFLLVIAIVSRGGMGIGDVKLAAMVGSVIGVKYTIIGIFIGSLIGSIISLILIGFNIKDRKDRIPFGPFIAIGTVVMIFYGNVIINWYLDLLAF